MAILLVILFCTIMLVAIGLSVMMYVFEGFGLMEMAKKKNEKNYWLAWIPYAKEYLRGKIAYGTNKGAVMYLCIAVGMVVISFILSFIINIMMTFYEDSLDIVAIPLIIFTIITLLVSITYMVFYYITAYKIFKQFSENAVLMIVFTILTSGAMAPIFYFAIRKNNLRIEKNE